MKLDDNLITSDSLKQPSPQKVVPTIATGGSSPPETQQDELKLTVLTREQIKATAGYTFSDKVWDMIHDLLVDQRDADQAKLQPAIEQARQQERAELIATLEDYLSPLSPDINSLLVISVADWQALTQ